MRMWMVDPKVMCRKHLLGEHVEIHMFVGSMNRGTNIYGFLKKRLIETTAIISRHEELVVEMKRRGYAHKSPLPEIMPYPKSWDEVKVDRQASMVEILRRCQSCRDRVESLEQGEAS